MILYYLITNIQVKDLILLSIILFIAYKIINFQVSQLTPDAYNS